MKDNALAVANYFIELANKEGKNITLLGLINRVYIAHGFSLAIFDKSLLDPRFDRVEAWRYGPVIPCVYQSFKHHKAHPIKEETIVMTWDEARKRMEFKTPKLEDKDARAVVEMVWKRYHNMSDGELVDLTHKKGTPWYLCYIPDENREIPDILTEEYYKQVIEAFRSKQK